MDIQQKHEALTKKVNQYTTTPSEGQTTKLTRDEIKHAFNVNLGRDPYDGQIGKANEYKIYEFHPDNKQLLSDLSKLRKQQQDKEKAIKEALQPKVPQVPQQPQGSASMNPYGGSGLPQGHGGPIDNFGQKLAEGASAVREKMGQVTPSQATFTPSPNATYPNISSSGLGSGMRTDRHNNPTAFTTDVARNAGLVPGVDYTVGDPFNNGQYHTANLLGDPFATTAKVIDKLGFYTQTGKPRWTYVNQIPGIENWSVLNMAQKSNIISQMAQHEGSKRFAPKKSGQGGPIDKFQNLGNITTKFGDQTKDTNFHTGVDVANKSGTPIPKLSGMGGTVTSVGMGANPDYGNQVVVKNDDGTTESYSHLSQSMVQPGQRVAPNQPIAKMGATGNSWSANGGDPSHLHFEISDAYGKYVNPVSYI